MLRGGGDFFHIKHRDFESPRLVQGKTNIPKPLSRVNRRPTKADHRIE
jgi:hypothetical protein